MSSYLGARSMTTSALAKASATTARAVKRSLPVPAFKNGMGMYVPAIHKIKLEYCERSGSSRGAIQFLKSDLHKFAAAHPHIQIVVTPRPSKHPLATGTFASGRDKVLSLRNLDPTDIRKQLRLLTDAADALNKHPVRGGVTSTTKAVRGIWSPFKQV
ncbi:hypothetical protein BC828DRAFT_374957 [Blastocladiella britannica]|nr:hypothetical protein BC828DRAFT_374957 [Blastocladiella britannica]